MIKLNQFFHNRGNFNTIIVTPISYGFTFKCSNIRFRTNHLFMCENNHFYAELQSIFYMNKKKQNPNQKLVDWKKTEIIACC